MMSTFDSIDPLPVTPDSLVAEIEMLKGVESRTILLLEGEQDLRAFDYFVDDEQCRLITTGGRKTLLATADIASSERISHVVGFADADHRVGEVKVKDLSNVIFTDLNDLDSEIISTAGVAKKVALTHTTPNS